MKFVIVHKTTKREIKGAFNICGSREDLMKLAKQIEEQAEENFTYGWVNIVPDKQEHIADTKPLGWEE